MAPSTPRRSSQTTPGCETRGGTCREELASRSRRRTGRAARPNGKRPGLDRSAAVLAHEAHDEVNLGRRLVSEVPSELEPSSSGHTKDRGAGRAVSAAGGVVHESLFEALVVSGRRRSCAARCEAGGDNQDPYAAEPASKPSQAPSPRLTSRRPSYQGAVMSRLASDLARALDPGAVPRRRHRDRTRGSAKCCGPTIPGSCSTAAGSRASPRPAPRRRYTWPSMNPAPSSCWCALSAPVPRALSQGARGLQDLGAPGTGRGRVGAVADA